MQLLVYLMSIHQKPHKITLILDSLLYPFPGRPMDASVSVLLLGTAKRSSTGREGEENPIFLKRGNLFVLFFIKLIGNHKWCMSYSKLEGNSFLSFSSSIVTFIDPNFPHFADFFASNLHLPRDHKAHRGPSPGESTPTPGAGRAVIPSLTWKHLPSSGPDL